MLFQLALALGYPHPRRMMRELSADEIVDWIAYYSIEPFGEYKMDARFANLMALEANINRDPKKRRRPFTPDDFMPKPPAPPPSPEDVERKVYGIMRAIAARSKR